MMERGAEVNGGDADQLSKRSTRGRRRVRGRTLLALPLMVASLVGPVAAAQAAPGDLTLLSRADGLGGAGGLSLDNKSSSFGASISASGRFVAFTSEANNLSLFDNDAVVNVFMRDMVDGSIILVCCASGSSTGAAEASISGDGRNIVFSSTDDNLSTEDNNAFNNVFVYLRAFGTTSLVSVGPGGTAADGNSSGASISADGHHVVFSSGADNLSDVDNNNNVTNVFRRGLLPGGGTTYVSRANGADGAPVPPVPLERTAISGDGNLVAFSSTAIGLSPEDTPDQQEEDVFVRDVALGTTALVSRADGVTGAGIGGTSPSFSADGRFLVFVGGRTVYRRDRVHHTTTIVSRADGPDGAPVSENFLYPSISDDGRFVAFSGRAITGTGISSDDLVDPRERPFGNLAGGKLDDCQVFLLDLGAQLQVGRGHDDRLRRRVHLLRRLVLHEVVGAVSQSAPGENGNGKNGKNSAAHV